VVSTDGLLLGKEARILLKKLSARLAEKWEKAYSGAESADMVSMLVHEHSHRQSHPSLSPWISHSDEQNVQPTPAVGGQSRHRPLPTSRSSLTLSSCLLQFWINEAFDPYFLVSSFFEQRGLLLYLLLQTKLKYTSFGGPRCRLKKQSTCRSVGY
jgi:hypothetical protein